jgi:Xaa-Pro aminopeptidase
MRYLFTNLDRIDLDLQAFLQKQVTLQPYELYGETLKALVAQAPNQRVLIDRKHTTMGTHELLTDPVTPIACKIVEGSNPIEGMKARKNAIEISQMQQANLKASRAKTRTLKWVSDQFNSEKRLQKPMLPQPWNSFMRKKLIFKA